MYGLKPEGLDQTFTHRGETFKIIGLESGKRYAVQTEMIGSGRRSDFTAYAVKEHMGWATRLLPQASRRTNTGAATSPSPQGPQLCTHRCIPCTGSYRTQPNPSRRCPHADRYPG